MSYNPSDGTASNTPYATSGKPDSARSYYYDKGDTFRFRPFLNVEEVIEYFPNAADRVGHFTIIINTGGVLQSSGYILGGSNEEWWWKDGVEDEDLIVKQAPSSITFNYVTPVGNELNL